jgi:hypothetical protein
MSSSYACKLLPEAKARYFDKLKIIADFDPFVLLEKRHDERLSRTDLPCVDASDLVSYLVLQTSYLTAKQFKARKSLEAYNQFVSGWVKEVIAWEVKGTKNVVVTGRVSISNIMLLFSI